MLKWSDGKPLTESQIQTITGLTIKRPSCLSRLRRATEAGITFNTLSDELRYLMGVHRTQIEALPDGQEIVLDASQDEARRAKTIREALLIDEKRKQESIRTQLLRQEVFELDAIQPAWDRLIVSLREGLKGMIPTIVARILPLTDEDEAIDRAMSELRRHLHKLSQFSLRRELDPGTNEEHWEHVDNAESE